MSEILVVVDYGNDAEDLNDSFLVESTKKAFERCLKECKKISEELVLAGFKSKLHVSENQLSVENEDDHSMINFFFQPFLGQKKEACSFGEEQAKV